MPAPLAPLTQHFAQESYQLVLAKARAFLPKPCCVDERNKTAPNVYIKPETYLRPLAEG